MALIEQWLVDSLERGEWLCLHLDASNTSKFVIGVVCGLSEEWICLRLADRSGRFDGFLVVRTESMVRVSRGGPYYDGVVAATKGHAVPAVPLENPADIEAVMAFLRADRRAVWLHDFYGSPTKGFVGNFDGEEVELVVYTGALQYEGNELIRLEHIEQVEFGGPDQELLENHEASAAARRGGQTSEAA